MTILIDDPDTTDIDIETETDDPDNGTDDDTHTDTTPAAAARPFKPPFTWYVHNDDGEEIGTGITDSLAKALSYVEQTFSERTSAREAFVDTANGVTFRYAPDGENFSWGYQEEDNTTGDAPYLF